jgi:UDP-N-acetylmuramoyl-L-alanyl-D-glutamate--2,6-diaminopimelate ligase
MSNGMQLKELMAGVLNAPPEIQISDITLDSREVRPGALFLACKGIEHHGLDFAEQAISKGARAVLYEEGGTERSPPLGRSEIFVAGVPELSRHVGMIADRFFGAPSRQLRVVGVTGTNGKTTCSYLLAQAFSLCGFPAAYIGTLGFGKVGGTLTPSNHTTSDAVSLQRWLAEMRDNGAACVGMEVSSHALDQSRVDGVRFNTAAFTNLTHDHLDYHGTMEAYGAAKTKLFNRETLEVRVINVDDPFGERLASQVAPGRLVVTSKAETLVIPTTDLFHSTQYVKAEHVRMLPAGISIEIESSWGESTFTVPLIGEFNVDNVLTVLGVLLSAGVSLGEAVKVMGQCSAPPGRMEVFGGKTDQPVAIVDYAHTPDALAKALRGARLHTKGKLRVVFGCGGDRDVTKRSPMGKIASELADEAIVTDDNPRNEAPEKIVADILAGLAASESIQVEHDRAKAIQLALQRSAVGDVVLIAGKGHEDYQIYGAERRPFSDQAVVRAVFGAQP